MQYLYCTLIDKYDIDIDKWVRKVSRFSFWIFVAGGILFLFGLALPSVFPAPVLLGGVLLIIVSLVARAVVLVDRMWRKHLQKSARAKSSVVPAVYTCHHCGYQLRGVRGVGCPECGIVRQTFTEDDDIELPPADVRKAVTLTPRVRRPC